MVKLLIGLFVVTNLVGGMVIRDGASKTVSSVIARPTRIPKPTATPRPTMTITPTPTVGAPSKPSEPPSVTSPVITKVEVFDGTSGESTFGYVTGVKVTGSNIGFEAKMILLGQDNKYTGMYQGGDGSTWILTDFLGLPHCQTFHVKVTGDNGSAVAKNAVRTVCP